MSPLLDRVKKVIRHQIVFSHDTCVIILFCASDGDMAFGICSIQIMITQREFFL